MFIIKIYLRSVWNEMEVISKYFTISVSFTKASLGQRTFFQCHFFHFFFIFLSRKTQTFWRHNTTWPFKTTLFTLSVKPLVLKEWAQDRRNVQESFITLQCRLKKPKVLYFSIFLFLFRREIGVRVDHECIRRHFSSAAVAKTAVHTSRNFDSFREPKITSHQQCYQELIFTIVKLVNC